MKKILMMLLTMVAVLPLPGATPTAQEVMKRTAATLNRSTGVSIGFRVSGSQSSSGVLVVSGKKFFLDAGRNKVWYDGRDMTTLNLNTSEATLTRPGAAEVNETFPLSYLTEWQRDYSVAFAARQPKGAYCLVLTSKRAAAVAKKAVLTVNASNFTPRKLVISLKRGGTSTVTITKFSTGGNAIASNYRYPAGKYPRVKVIDLR